MKKARKRLDKGQVIALVVWAVIALAVFPIWR